MSKVYDAALVDGYLEKASGAMDGVIKVAEGVLQKNEALQKENAELRQKLAAAESAAADKVSLQKVAAPKALPLDTVKVAAFVDLLVAHGCVPQSARARFIDKCAADGNVAVEVATEALKFSETPVNQGHGIKTASSNSLLSSEELSYQDEKTIWANHGF